MRYTVPCPECGQQTFVEAHEEATEEELLDLARETCTCQGAQYAKAMARSKQRVEEFLENEFGDDPTRAAVINAASQAVYQARFDNVKIKCGKNAYTIDIKDGLVRIRKKFTDTTETTL